MLRKVTIYGERCSGTSYLEELLLANFDVEIVWSYGWKHFFGFNDLSNSDDVLFIGIVRNLTDWVNSLFREHHHLQPELKSGNVSDFLNKPCYSFHDSGVEIMEDRNIETKERYTNIFESRHIKNKFLVESMPNLVSNYLLITHDNLVDDFTNVMNQIKNCNLPVKSNIEFPINIHHYKHHEDAPYIKKQNTIPDDMIIEKANLHYEEILFPKMQFLSA